MEWAAHNPVKGLSYFGGKTTLAPWILPYLPPHETYIEAFAGSAAVLLAKKPSPLEVINDLDEGLIGFYRVLRDPVLMPELVRRVSFWPYSRQEYLHARATWHTCPDPVEKAVRWFVVSQQSFSGSFGRSWALATGTGPNGVGSSKAITWSHWPDRLIAIHARLRQVQVEHYSWEKLVPIYDGPHTLWYLDPPYVPGTRGANATYAHELTDADHRQLVDTCLTMQGMILLSGYANDLYQPLEEAGWVRKERPSMLSSRARTRSHHGKGTNQGFHHFKVECLWMNPQAITRQRQVTWDFTPDPVIP